jgi:DNA polymerase-3 subunit epsilon
MSAGWADGPLYGFDLETTSPLPTEARIVTASVVSTQNGTTASTNWLADPGVEIPTEASEIHGVTTEHARAHGRPVAEVTPEVVARITKAWANGWPVVIYNACYDLTVLHHELIRHCSSQGIGEIGPVIDPLIIDKHVDRYRKGKRTLTAACGHYRIELTDAHTSEADALAAMRVCWKLAKGYPEIGKMSLDELQIAQAEWYCEQQLSFATYLRGKVAKELRFDAAKLEGDERDAKLTELQELIDRADLIVAEADGWPLRMAS